MTDKKREKVQLELQGVPETLLWPLYNRASEARRPNAFFHDPFAVQIADGIDYPFEQHFGPPNEFHVLRALRFDEQIKRYLQDFPECTVVALADGLETQVHRVDNGRLKWLAVDLPETIAVRKQVLPDTDRHRNLACSALDLRWMDEVDPAPGVFITAQGLLMYFQPDEVRGFIAACAKRFRGGRMMFDVIPRWYSEKTLRGYKITRSYTTPRMPFGMDVDEIPSIRSFHPNIKEVKEIPIGRGRGFHFRYRMPARNLLPVIRNQRTSLVRVMFG
jgi:O-methyltransferase involved in polyketide biosynthesis